MRIRITLLLLFSLFYNLSIFAQNKNILKYIPKIKHDKLVFKIPQGLTIQKDSIIINNKYADINLKYFILKSKNKDFQNKINSNVANLKSVESLDYCINHYSKDANDFLNEAKIGIEDLKKYSKENQLDVPDYQYYLYIDNTIEYISREILNFTKTEAIFTGGAHGMYNITSTFIDMKTGCKIANEKLFNNYQEFTKMAEIYFRKENNIPFDESINSTGFWFDNDKFFIPENLLFTNEGVQLLYPLYSIAPYSAGIIECTIPYSALLK